MDAEVKVEINADSKFPVDRKEIRRRVALVLSEKGAEGKVLVSVAVVGDRKMRQLNRKYRKKDYPTDVLSFPTSDPSQDIGDSGFFQAREIGLVLGDIVVSYPQSVMIAVAKNKLLDEVVGDLVEHGMLHLLGFHHDE